jgi:hypothetical protein
VVVQIKKPKNLETPIHNSRTVAALLAILQNVHPDTYLAPTDITITDSDILNPLNVPPTDIALDPYITYETDVPPNTMMGRLHFRTNNRLSEYKKDMQLSKYLAKEHMVIEEMTLASINPPTVGFIENMIPDPEILRIHTIRLRKYLPPNHPRFQLFVKTLYNSKRHGTRVVMVKCDPENVETIDEIFKQLDIENVIQFFSWKEFISLTPSLKDTAFHKQVLFNKHFRSVVLSGFKDNEDNVKMVFKLSTNSTNQTSITNNKDPLEDVYVTDYLQDWITAGNGSNLFHHVYEPIDGKRDTIVHINNLAEANNFATVVMSEPLARVMNTPAKVLVIADLPTAEAGTKKPKWQPYTQAAKLTEDRNNMNYYNNKRRRTEVNQTPSKQPTANPTNSPPTINNNTNNKVWKTNSPQITEQLNTDTIDELEAHVQEQIEKNNRVIREEINEANQSMNKRIVNLDKKLDNHSNSVQYELKEIKEQNQATQTSVQSNVDRLESIFWKMWSKFEDPPEELETQS